MEKTDLNRGVIERKISVVCENLDVGESQYITYYGKSYLLTRVDSSRYGMVAIDNQRKLYYGITIIEEE